jgi:RNA polymerase sigma-70 factor, ECF subfamily
MRPFVRTSAADAPALDPRREAQQLFDEHGPPLFRFCRYTLGRVDEAEDVVQDTFLKLLQHLTGEGDRTNLKAWLFTVAANACRDRMRWRIRWIPWRVELDRRIAPLPEERPDQRLASAALRRLSRRDRLLLSFRAQEPVSELLTTLVRELARRQR